jgi:hypothetical protein
MLYIFELFKKLSYSYALQYAIRTNKFDLYLFVLKFCLPLFYDYDKNFYTELTIDTVTDIAKLNMFDLNILKYFWVCPQKNSNFFVSNDEMIEFINKFLSSKTKHKLTPKNITNISKIANLLIFLQNNFNDFFWKKYKKEGGWSFTIKNFKVIDFIKNNNYLKIPGKCFKPFDLENCVTKVLNNKLKRLKIKKNFQMFWEKIKIKFASNFYKNFFFQIIIYPIFPVQI